MTLEQMRKVWDTILDLIRSEHAISFETFHMTFAQQTVLKCSMPSTILMFLFIHM
jgi:hypothetical protein